MNHQDPWLVLISWGSSRKVQTPGRSSEVLMDLEIFGIMINYDWLRLIHDYDILWLLHIVSWWIAVAVAFPSFSSSRSARRGALNRSRRWFRRQLQLGTSKKELGDLPAIGLPIRLFPAENPASFLFLANSQDLRKTMTRCSMMELHAREARFCPEAARTVHHASQRLANWDWTINNSLILTRTNHQACVIDDVLFTIGWLISREVCLPL